MRYRIRPDDVFLYASSGGTKIIWFGRTLHQLNHLGKEYIASIGGSTMDTLTLNGNTSYAKAYSQILLPSDTPQNIPPQHDGPHSTNSNSASQSVQLTINPLFHQEEILNPVILIICPLRRLLIPGKTHRIIFAVPKKFTSNCSRKFQSLISSTAPTNATISLSSSRYLSLLGRAGEGYFY
jgi:hypothetical protein